MEGVQGARAAQLAAAPLALMRRLEASLGASREALLALDLAGMARATREQIVLLGELRAGYAGASGSQDLRRSAQRILDAARLQSALLARAQRKLRVVASMLAGPSSTYKPLSAPNDAVQSGLRTLARI